jgi:hypothetical protein
MPAAEALASSAETTALVLDASVSQRIAMSSSVAAASSRLDAIHDWRVTPIYAERANKEHVPPMPGPGRLFTSTDAELRFLAMGEDLLPFADDLKEWSRVDLASLLRLAKPLEA